MSKMNLQPSITRSRKPPRIWPIHFAVHMVMLVACFICILPIVYTFVVSIRPLNSFISSNFTLIPKGATIANYQAILFDRPFFVWLRNSLILALATVVFSLAVSIPAAYAYSRWKFRLKRFTLYLFLLLNAFPGILTMVAIYRLLHIMGLMNTYIGLIIIYTGGMVIFGIWNMKGYFDTIPVEMEEAAMIDGAGNWQLLWKILLPLAKPTIIVTGMLVFINAWNEYIYAVNFLTDRSHFTLAAGLYSLQGTEYTRNWPLFAAGALLVSFPVLVVFFISQKQMLSGLTVGGVKY